MVLRNVPKTDTFEQQRQELNELAVDVFNLKQQVDTFNLNDLVDVDAAGANIAQIIKYDGTQWVLDTDIVSTSFTVINASPGSNSNLAYNNTNGTFTYTPPDLSPYRLATATLNDIPGVTISNPINTHILQYNGSVWTNQPFSGVQDLNDIGNVFINNVQNDQVLKWDSTNNRWTNATDAGGTQINTINDIGNVSDTNTQNGQLLKYNSSAGRWENFTPTYISSFTETDPIFSASAAAGITSTLINNWNTAHGWGNHASQGYLTTVALNDVSDVDLSVAPSDGQVLKWEAASSKWKASTDLTGGGGGGLALTDLSVTSSTAAGGGALTYNNNTGVFSYTPPDLSSYITSIGDAIQDADFTTSGLMKRTGAGVYTSTTDNSSNWDTAFGWGNHASQGYLTQLPVHGLGVHTGVTLTNETAGDLLQYSGTQWVNWTPNYLTAETDTLQSVITRNGTVTSGNPAFNTSTFFTGTGTGAGNGGKPYFLWDAANNQLVGSDNIEIVLGFNGDQKIKTDGTNVLYNNFANVLHTIENSGEREAWNSKVSGVFVPSFKINHNAAVELYHANGQIRLATSSTGVTVTGALTAGGLTYPTVNGTNGQVLTSDGAGNVAWGAGGGGGASVTISDTPPAASAGDLWWESDSGRLKIYYQDVDSAQWVDVAPPLAPALSSNAPATASSTGSAGDIRYDSGYVYVCVATDTWKRAALTTW